MAKKIETFDDAVKEVSTYPANVLINIAAQALINSQTKETVQKIVISEEQFKAFFRIKGITESGEKETRGRKPKELEPEAE